VIPVWGVLIIVAAFFIREAYQKSKPSNYETGYKDALREMSKEWNSTCRRHTDHRLFAEEFKKYMQSKIEEWDVKGL
jgi:hypothetical protein